MRKIAMVLILRCEAQPSLEGRKASRPRAFAAMAVERVAERPGIARKKLDKYRFDEAVRSA
jgi:hypothetical protein